MLFVKESQPNRTPILSGVLAQNYTASPNTLGINQHRFDHDPRISRDARYSAAPMMLPNGTNLSLDHTDSYEIFEPMIEFAN